MFTLLVCSPLTKRLALVVTILAIAAAPAASTGLITNGDFEAGNTGFTSSVPYIATGPTPTNSYAIRTDASTGNTQFCNNGDHTTGSGLLMVVDSAVGPAWSQTVNLPAGNYVFSAWVNNLLCGANNFADPDLELRANGATVAGPVVLPENLGVWLNLSGSFVTTSAGPVVLEVWSNSNAPIGNDFGIDDICLDVTVPVTTSTWSAVKATFR